MSQTVSPISRSPFHPEGDINRHRSIPILATNTPKQEDRMEMGTPPPPGMGPPGSTSSPEGDHDMQNSNTNGRGSVLEKQDHVKQQNTTDTTTTNGNSSHTLSAAAAATSQQPKVVQTAFIHKLYNMLEDHTIRHLISWSSSNESFVMSPSQDFSKVLSQYFKHTNISSFVRQLNMYGFHKVSDVFHTGAPESALWEFKHGQGNFKRGDLAGLREIKRRASRHALIHRDSFSSPHKPSVSQPGTPAEPVQETNNASGDPRMNSVEHALAEVYARLARTEESNSALSSKCAMLSDNLARAQQWNSELSQIVLKMMPDSNGQLQRDLSQLQKEMQRSAELLRNYEESHDPRQMHFGPGGEVMPLSPRQRPQEERRPSLHGAPPRTNLFRGPPPASSNAMPSPRRFGSFSNASGQGHLYHPRPSVTIQPPHTPTHATPHPLATVAEPGAPPPSHLARRHTSADIRDSVGWPPNGLQPPVESTGSSQHQQQHAPPHWPPSPECRDPQAQHIRESLSSFEFGKPRRSTVVASRGASPPAPHVDPGQQPLAPPVAPPPLPQSSPFASVGENGWTFQSATKGNGVRFAGGGGPDSAPGTRRTSLASNVHSLLNPTGEKDPREDAEGYGDGGEERKRKRIA